MKITNFVRVIDRRVNSRDVRINPLDVDNKGLILLLEDNDGPKFSQVWITLKELEYINQFVKDNA